jgi:ClpP class serine protease
MASHITSFCRNNNLKLFTFAESAALSGGYWLLSIGDEVYGYKSSKIGSIGALFTLIDVKEFIDERKIERIYIQPKKKDEKAEK